MSRDILQVYIYICDVSLFKQYLDWKVSKTHLVSSVSSR